VRGGRHLRIRGWSWRLPRRKHSFLNVLLGDEEEMKESKSIEREEDEESIRLKHALGSQVKERKNKRGRSTEGEKRERIRRELGDSLRACRRKEIMEMDTGEMEEEIRRTEEAIDDNLRRRAEWAGIAVEQDVIPSRKRVKPIGNKLPWMLLFLGVAGMGSGPVEAFTAYDCSNRSNIVESNSLLEPEACAASDGNREMETVAYGERVQMKQDRIIPIFRCQVVETIISQYCGHWSRDTLCPVQGTKTP
jgi:hypothetical protein